MPVNNLTTIDELFGYTGRDWDDDADLQYNRARWYEPTMGRWMSPDPIGFEGGDANLYRYVGNHPTSTTDPSGLWWDPIGDFARWWVGPSKKQEDRASGVDPEKARQSILASNVDYGSKAVTEQATRTRQQYYENSADFVESAGDLVGVSPVMRLATQEHLNARVTTNGELVFDGVALAAAPIIGGGGGKVGSAAKIEVKQAPKGVIGFAQGTAVDAVRTLGRVDHAGRHLADQGVIAGRKGSTAFREAVRSNAIRILENPLKTFDHEISGQQVKGFYGMIDGKQVVFFVAKESRGKIEAGELVTAWVPSLQQIINWGL